MLEFDIMFDNHLYSCYLYYVDLMDRKRYRDSLFIYSAKSLILKPGREDLVYSFKGKHDLKVEFSVYSSPCAKVYELTRNARANGRNCPGGWEVTLTSRALQILCEKIDDKRKTDLCELSLRHRFSVLIINFVRYIDCIEGNKVDQRFWDRIVEEDGLWRTQV